MEIVLSILICTTSERSEVIKPLLLELSMQRIGYDDLVEILINDHETDCVGKKRNDLLKLAKGEYVTAIDSDDHISKDYISLILQAAKSQPDCIGISGWITTNGTNKRDWHISKDYGRWYQVGDIYYRTPNHISPIRRDIALRAMFPEISFAEDFEFSMRVLPMLKTEHRIFKPIYHYDYRDKK